MSPLQKEIMAVLRDAGAEALSKAQIVERLRLPSGGGIEGRKARAALDRELWDMANRGWVQFEYPNARRPEFHFWINPPVAERIRQPSSKRQGDAVTLSRARCGFESHPEGQFCVLPRGARP